ncbi:tyrosine-type recombinase/integrase [Paenibacillus sp. GD4]|uniref:site-specific integrase n=1 Tax=Paenibacillus sp. GD4 TaxID=3068890 RepID=UPI002796DA6C|nr:tyrosine-type recombinase/integrase [Paenibacillus sp. GD4]MDQ1910550.1 tyrosine-type recombinase/integrase [Paenibacillus sp. GD4]
MASLQKRGNDSWLLVVEAGIGADGKRIRRTKTVKAKGIREARKLLAEFETEVEAGHYIAPEKMTFAAFVEEWREKYAESELGIKTLDIYLRFLKNRILPVFGHMRLDKIQPFHVVNFIADLGKDGNRQDGKIGQLSSGTIQYNHRILKNIFSRAVEWRLIRNNPAADIKKPKVNRKEIEVYDEEEVALLFELLEKEPLKWRMMIMLAITTALRRGELVGLEWKHIDLDKGILEVRQSISHSINGQRIISEPKTVKSKRKVSLPDTVVEHLKEYYLEARKKRLALGDAWKGGDHFFVFSSDEGMAYYPETPYLWFRGFLKKHSLKYIRFHDLRHTSATLLINKGVHAKLISERLGHSNISTTMNVYGHAL